jgi:hypothetical protein
MKIKIFFLLAIVAALALGGSGCCTYLLVDSTRYTTRDTFNPSAMYQTTNHDSFALEGARFNDATEHGLSNSNHVFVLMPKARLLPPNLRTNDTLSLGDIQTLPEDYTKRLKTKTRLPDNYERIAGLPANHAGLVLQEHHPRRVRYVFTPFTVAADVATAPIQVICLGYLWWRFR